MSNVEIYDSSNSQLSSDEYSHDEDDDGLMDMAVSKQTPTKSAKSNDTSPTKTDSSVTTPRKLSDDLEAITRALKPPLSREHTRRQIKQMQRNNKANLYFKRRSIKWLNQRQIKKPDYLAQLRRIVPKRLVQARRKAEFRAAKRAIELEHQARQKLQQQMQQQLQQQMQQQMHHQMRQQMQEHLQQQMQQRRVRTPSPSRSLSRSRTGSISPVLICLDDTENEDSPEKPNEPPASNQQQQQQQSASKTAPPPFTLQLDIESEATPAENGSVLDEFLTMKPAIAAEPVIEEAAACNQNSLQQHHQLQHNQLQQQQQQHEQMQLQLHQQQQQLLEEEVEALDLEVPALDMACKTAIEPADGLDMIAEEATMKRRRSVTPPMLESNMDKRSKTFSTEDLDDEVIELTPDETEPAKPPTPPPVQLQQQQQQHEQLLQQQHLQQQQQLHQQQQQQQPQPQQQQQQLPPPQTTPLHKLIITQSVVAAPRPAIIEQLKTFKMGSPHTVSPSSGMEYYAQKKALCQQHQMQSQSQPEKITAISYSLETPSPSVEAMDIVYPNEKPLAISDGLKASAGGLTQTVSAPAVIQQQTAPEEPMRYAWQNKPLQPQQQSPQQQQPLSQQQQPPAQQQPQQPSARPKQRADSTSSKHTQTSQTNAARSKSSVDLNNSDAVFHQRVKDLYTELDEIMTDKVRAVKPELKSYGEEKLRIEADIKTLDNLICQKEEEYNRLLHLRCIKEELLARLERKERILIMKEILPSVLNKNCSTSELYEMHSLLLNEQNSPMPSRYGATAMEQLINRVENGLDDIKILRGALGLQNKSPPLGELSMPPPPPLPQHFEASLLQQRRDSVRVMRQSLPAMSTSRSSVYGRASLREDYHREQPEELSKRIKAHQPPSRYQQLINESKQLTSSTNDLSAASTNRQQQQQQQQQPMETQRSQSHALENNHYEQEPPLKPLFNSSPLSLGSQRKHNDTNSQYNDIHSMYRSELLQGIESLDRAAASQIHRNSINNRSKQLSAATNGPEELDRRCQYCERYKATYMCASCQNQWYCSRECQVRAWDTHWESCPN